MSIILGYAAGFIIGVLLGAISYRYFWNKEECSIYCASLVFAEVAAFIVMFLITDNFFEISNLDDDGPPFLLAGLVFLGHIIGLAAASASGRGENRSSIACVTLLVVMVSIIGFVPGLLPMLVTGLTLIGVTGVEFYLFVVMIGFEIFAIILWAIMDRKGVPVALMIFSVLVQLGVALNIMNDIAGLSIAMLLILSITRVVGEMFEETHGAITDREVRQAVFLLVVLLVLEVVTFAELMQAFWAYIGIQPFPVPLVVTLIVVFLCVVIFVWGLDLFSYGPLERWARQRWIGKAEREAIEHYRDLDLKRAEDEAKRQQLLTHAVKRRAITSPEKAREAVLGIIWKAQREIGVLLGMSDTTEVFWTTYERVHDELLQARALCDQYQLNDLISQADNLLSRVEMLTGAQNRR